MNRIATAALAFGLAAAGQVQAQTVSVVAYEQQYQHALGTEWSSCNKTGFDHDMKNLAVLAQLAAEASYQAQNNFTSGASSRSVSQADILAQVKSQRSNPNSQVGSAYNTSVRINNELAGWQKANWAHCLRPTKAEPINRHAKGALVGGG